MRYFNNSLFIEFDGNQKNVLSGTIKGVSIESVKFNDLNQLLVLFDQVCNKLMLPQSSVQLRTFSNKERTVEFETREVGEIEFGKDSKVLQIIISKRQNASWQGQVFSEDNKWNFESELEFIDIINEFVCE